MSAVNKIVGAVPFSTHKAEDLLCYDSVLSSETKSMEELFCDEVFATEVEEMDAKFSDSKAKEEMDELVFTQSFMQNKDQETKSTGKSEEISNAVLTSEMCLSYKKYSSSFEIDGVSPIYTRSHNNHDQDSLLFPDLPGISVFSRTCAVDFIFFVLSKDEAPRSTAQAAVNLLDRFLYASSQDQDASSFPTATNILVIALACVMISSKFHDDLQNYTARWLSAFLFDRDTSPDKAHYTRAGCEKQYANILIQFEAKIVNMLDWQISGCPTAVDYIMAVLSLQGQQGKVEKTAISEALLLVDIALMSPYFIAVSHTALAKAVTALTLDENERPFENSLDFRLYTWQQDIRELEKSSPNKRTKSTRAPSFADAWLDLDSEVMRATMIQEHFRFTRSLALKC